MQEISIRRPDDPDRQALQRLLWGRVFHLTSARAFAAIRRSGYIHHNQLARYPLNAGSADSFGRRHGYVCLYDLRTATPARLALCRELCDFLQPDWLADGKETPAYLLLRPAACARLIPNAAAFYACRASGQHLKYLPGVECWYPGDLPVTAVGTVVRICD